MKTVALFKRVQLLTLILAVPCAYAAPTITNESGKVSQGGTITINGSGFGANAHPAPIYYSNFNSYPVGTQASVTGLHNLNGNPGSRYAYVDGTRGISGNKALRQDWPSGINGFFPEIGLTGLNLTQVYVSAWIYWVRTAGTGYGPNGVLPIVKMVRAESGTPYHGIPGFYEVIRPTPSGAIGGVDRGSVSASGITTNDDARNAEPNLGAWHKVSYYFKLSAPGVANGIFQNWVDGVRDADITNTMSRPAGNTSTINNVISPFCGFTNYGYSNAYTMWMGNFYVAATRARVELGDASTFSASKVRYIQPAISWSDGSISATAETNKFASGTKAYLYVIDANGNVNSQGYPVTISGAVLPNAPVMDGVN